MSALFDEHKQHIDPSTGELLVGAKIYIGEPGLDPKINPKNIYDNRGLTGAPLAQPQLTGADGRSINKIYVSGRYSYIIDSSADVEKYNELQNGAEEAVGNIQTTNALGVNDIVVTGVPVQTAYIDNKTYIVTAPADNTGAMTINLDAIGVIPIKKAHDQAIVSGDVKAGMKLVLVYNSTDAWMELQSAVLGSVFGGDVTVIGELTAGSIVNLATKYKTSDTSRANVDSTGKTADPHLNGFQLLPNIYYKVRAFLWVDSDAGYFSWQFVVDNAFQIEQTNVTGNDGVGNFLSSLPSANNLTVSRGNITSADHVIEVFGVVKTHATLTSSVDLIWAQNSANAAPTVLKNGSWITFEKMG